MSELWRFLISNRDWVFEGIGVFVLTGIVVGIKYFLSARRKSAGSKEPTTTTMKVKADEFTVLTEENKQLKMKLSNDYIEKSKVASLRWKTLTTDEQNEYYQCFINLKPKLYKPKSVVVGTARQEELQRINPIDLTSLKSLFLTFGLSIDNIKLPIEADEYDRVHSMDVDSSEYLFKRAINGVNIEQKKCLDSVYDYLSAQELSADQEFQRKCDVIVVPGCRSDIKFRIDEAYRIWSISQAQLVITGYHPYYDENQALPIGEAEAMYFYLTNEKGLDVERFNVFVENRARNTLENVVHTLPILNKVRNLKGAPLNLILVTSPYHMRRFYFSTNKWLASERHIVHDIRCVVSSTYFNRGNWYLKSVNPKFADSYGVGVYIGEYFKIIGGRATGEF